jgi:hypothetical protein
MSNAAKISADRIASLVHLRAEQDESCPSSAVRDTITDLRHFCDAEAIEFNDVLQGSGEVYLEEADKKKSGLFLDFKCFACGAGMRGITVHDFKHNDSNENIDFQFCPNHAIMWALRSLNPETIKKMRAHAGCETHTTHEDFYDENGNALQPVND